MSLMMRTTSGRSLTSGRLLRQRRRKQMRDRQLAVPYSQGQHFFTPCSLAYRLQYGTYASKEYLGMISSSPSVTSCLSPMQSLRSILTQPRRSELRCFTQRYRMYMRFLNYFTSDSSLSSSREAQQFLRVMSEAMKPSIMPMYVLYCSTKGPTPGRTWLPNPSVGTPILSANRMRALINSLIFFSRSFHFLFGLRGSLLYSSGSFLACASRYRSMRPCMEILSVCVVNFLPLFVMFSICLYFQSTTTSRNQRESSWSLAELLRCSLMMGLMRACMELRMAWYLLCTYFALRLIS